MGIILRAFLMSADYDDDNFKYFWWLYSAVNLMNFQTHKNNFIPAWNYSFEKLESLCWGRTWKNLFKYIKKNFMVNEATLRRNIWVIICERNKDNDENMCNEALRETFLIRLWLWCLYWLCYILRLVCRDTKNLINIDRVINKARTYQAKHSSHV